MSGMRSIARTLKSVLDSKSREKARIDGDYDRVEWVRAIPFFMMHAAVGLVFLVGVDPVSVGVAVGLYGLRMVAITGFYHRYFSHRAFATSRWFQGTMAVLGAAAVQRGPLWWAAHHRNHHRNADGPGDLHSPVRRGFWWSHVGWFLTPGAYPTQIERVKDLARFPELRFLDRFDWFVPLLLAAMLLLAGVVLETHAPSLGTNGPRLFTWGFVISTVVAWHATFTINSLAHGKGRRRYDTPDQSRNSWILALLTFGEGWHNNHHRYQSAARQGFFWWEIDFTWYLLRVLESLGLIWNLHRVPRDVLQEGTRKIAKLNSS